MSALTIFTSLTARRLAAFATFALALAATSAGAAGVSFVAGKIEVKEVKGTDFCKHMILEEMWATKDHISGYWRIRTATLESSGKFDVFAKKGKIVADMWGDGSEKTVETTKQVGPDLHVKVELNWISDVWSSDSGDCEVEFVLPDVLPQKIAAGSISKELAEEKSLLARLREEQLKESERLAELKAETDRRFAEEETRRAQLEEQSREAERLAKQRAEEETRLSRLREEQRKEAEQLKKLKAEAEQRLASEEARRAEIEARSRDAERLAKWRAEEEARFAKLREEQRKEADRLAKLKTEAEQRLAKGESLDADFERKLRDADRLAELQSKEAARLAKLRREQGKEAERLLRLKAEAEKRLTKEETRRVRLEEQTRVAERLAKKRAAEENRLAGLREEQRQEAERLAKQRSEEETRLAGLREEQRKEAELLAKQKTEAEKKWKADEAGIGGELKQQLAFLKNLKEEGLLDEQDFNSRKSALLNRFLGMKQSPSSLNPSTRFSKTVDDAILHEFSDVDFGKYYALVIGNNSYKYLPKLKTANNDAEAVAKILRENYSYEVSLMTDANHEDILDAFDEYREKLNYSDNLLIYYAGHGWLDEAGDEGYWLPVDARKNRRSKWISVASVTTAIKTLDANHVMVVADSCFSGTLV